MAALSPVIRASAVELCAKTLRDAVLRGDYQPGARLPPERQLAQTLAVNRVTVRGALAALVTEGLLSVRQGSGYEVKDVLASAGIGLLPALSHLLERYQGVELVRDLLEVRRAIARIVLQRLSHRRPKRAELEAISQAVDALERLPEDATPGQVAKADLHVLSTVVAATQSPALRLMVNPITDVLLALPGLQAAMYRAPEENVLGWRGLLALLSDSLDVDAALAVLEARDEATLSRYRRQEPA